MGGAGFLVDASQNQLLIQAGAAPSASRVPAIAAAMAFTWLANRKITFRTGDRPALPEAMRYLAVVSFFGYRKFAFNAGTKAREDA